MSYAVVDRVLDILINEPNVSLISLGYPCTMRWQTFCNPSLCPEENDSAFVTARVALPKNRVELMIGSQATMK